MIVTDTPRADERSASQRERPASRRERSASEPGQERSASPPEHDVETRFDVRIPTRDGLELSANLQRMLEGDHETH